MIKYKGSGLAGHEIAHSMGRELGLSYTKNLSTATDWMINDGNLGYFKFDTSARNSFTYTYIELNDSSLSITDQNTLTNTANNLYITYGYANAIETEEGLQGNYEIGTYTGTGLAGNKVTTKGKPAYLELKRLDDVGNWAIYDNQRANDGHSLYLNTSDSEYTAGDLLDFNEDGFTSTGNYGDNNTSGGQYLYFVIYDNDSGSGKSKYPKPTDTTNLNLANSYFNYTAGITENGYTLTSRDVTKSVDLSGVSDGLKWVSENSDGTNSFYDVKPSYGLYTKTSADDNRPVFVDNKWYGTVGGELVTNGTFDTDTDWVKTNAGIAISEGSLNFTSVPNGENANSPISLIAGIEYTITIDQLSLADSNGVWRLELSEDGGVSSFINFGLVNEIKTHTYTWVADRDVNAIRILNGNTTTNLKLDNISVYKVKPTISTEILPTPSFIKNPVYIDNQIPQYIDYSQELATNVMDSTVIDGDLRITGDVKSKNQCTAWVNFDGTTTPPTIRDSYNVSSVVRTSTGYYDVYFEKDMDNINFAIAGMVGWSIDNINIHTIKETLNARTHKKIRVQTSYIDTSAVTLNFPNNFLTIFGGKN